MRLGYPLIDYSLRKTVANIGNPKRLSKIYLILLLCVFGAEISLDFSPESFHYGSKIRLISLKNAL